jgi:hypothetical protein
MFWSLYSGNGKGRVGGVIAHKQCPREQRGAVVASCQETGYHAPSRWPASDFKHGIKSGFIILEEFKWH